MVLWATTLRDPSPVLGLGVLEAARVGVGGLDGSAHLQPTLVSLKGSTCDSEPGSSMNWWIFRIVKSAVFCSRKHGRTLSCPEALCLCEDL